MLRGIVEAVSRSAPDSLEPVLRNMAGAVGQLTPDTLLELLSNRSGAGRRPPLDERRRQPDVGHARSRSSSPATSSIHRRRPIAWRWPSRRSSRARKTANGCSRWRRRTSPSRRSAAPRASKACGSTSRRSCSPPTATSRSCPTSTGESCRARGRRAIEVEQVSDDPPERVSAWLSTVATRRAAGARPDAGARRAAHRRRSTSAGAK